MSGFYHKYFLRLFDFTLAELNGLLQLAAKLKADKKSGKEEARFTGKNVASIFERDSTRTRCFLKVATHDQGARVTYLGPSDGQIGHKESIKDTAHVLGRMYDGIQYRGYDQGIVGTLAEYAGMPVQNGPTSELYPTQSLADLLTMQEHLSDKAFNEVTLVYAGDACNDMGNSTLEVAAPTGLSLRLVAPQAHRPEAALVAECSALTQKYRGKITLTGDVAFGVKGTDLIYTDVRVSMGEPKEKWAERVALLRDYQANSKVTTLTNNSRVKFLHCLPAFYGKQTTLDKKMAAEFGLYGGMEVTGEVSESLVSTVSDRVEDQMRVIKAVMVAASAK